MLRFFLGDVRDLERLKMAMKEVNYVIHAAALKQVLAAEYNPMEFVKTNIYGAENVISASIGANVEKIIALSTDKAVNPINLYGATKLASDKIFLAANNMTGFQNNKFSIVRYGNVIGSRGSVVPLFQNYLKKGYNYLPITSIDMTRFWLTLDTAVNFVIFAFEIMSGKEIFIPKIPSIRIVDLARAMKTNIKFKIIGIRAGEKIHELMCPKETSDYTYEYKKFYIILNPSKDINRSIFLLNKKLKEKAKKVTIDFEYSSQTNKIFLSIPEIRKLNNDLFHTKE
jgi:UDP-N-acetylglucosamine 4,6-dehydratase